MKDKICFSQVATLPSRQKSYLECERIWEELQQQFSFGRSKVHLNHLDVEEAHIKVETEHTAAANTGHHDLISETRFERFNWIASFLSLQDCFHSTLFRKKRGRAQPRDAQIPNNCTCSLLSRKMSAKMLFMLPPEQHDIHTSTILILVQSRRSSACNDFIRT